MKKRNELSGPACVANEDGSIIVVALLLLMLLSLVVVAGSKTSVVEVLIAANKKASDRVFYIADGLANQAARILENQLQANPAVLRNAAGWAAGGLAREDNVPDPDGNPISLNTSDGRWQAGEFYDWEPPVGATAQTWPNFAVWGDSDGDGVSDNPSEATDLFDLLIVDKGIAEGASLDVNNPSQVREYNIRGRVISGSARDEVSIGYKMRIAN